jgi:hypothetical protein
MPKIIMVKKIKIEIISNDIELNSYLITLDKTWDRYGYYIHTKMLHIFGYCNVKPKAIIFMSQITESYCNNIVFSDYRKY